MGHPESFFDPDDRNFPATPEEVTDSMLLDVLGTALPYSASWCAEVHVNPKEPEPGPSRPNGEPSAGKLPVLHASWGFVVRGVERPVFRLSVPRLRTAVVETYHVEAVLGRLGDGTTPRLDPRQADAALQRALFKGVLFD
ncbi:hypothetical protein [Deinococcus sp. NW-56]|uniref:hypothetical protein n=1 Tax=Deinococcus sp. NW-56 TaxID=2080419 RepID=UPI000CF42B6D|nr:hypothetical protein [Deinococcus sp. NW-56]